MIRHECPALTAEGSRAFLDCCDAGYPLSACLFVAAITDIFMLTLAGDHETAAQINVHER